ncbi:MAG: UDP-N-acetylmuramoyl-L-alanine--D-glutamate ligase [Kiritimatiellae bacterium]|nr:UDP-N-acetylmuramoyl-L-alanine--D-glutamate ligase [Kiritimatiellia bacterium]
MARYGGINALVLGMGVSGEYAARLLLCHGARVWVANQGGEDRFSGLAERLRGEGAEVSFDADLPSAAFNFCVASPAFALYHPWLAECSRRGIPVISELELGCRHWNGRILAVTGSKGKSSLVKLCSDTLNAAGLDASPAGNYGIPLCQLVLEHPELRWAVVEVSSFQMEHTDTIRPDAAVLLNLQADHLDRHRCMAEYRAMKLKLFKAMRPGAVALLPEGFEAESGIIPDGVRIERFGAGDGADWRYDSLRHAVVGGPEEVSLARSWFDNEILGLAAAAGTGALFAAGLNGGQIEAGLENFEPLPHRMQLVAEDKNGVRYVDDSKATSLAAMMAALKMSKKPVRLIAGGLLKENDLENAKEMLTCTTKKVYLIGKCADQMFSAWAGALPCELCGTLDCAVGRAAQEADSGDTVLLSPGTASFDQFTGYRERGARFADLARKVAGLEVAADFSDADMEKKQ